ncbi:MAG: NB-ARC domain-containing protein, partial [Nitrospira sp.]
SAYLTPPGSLPPSETEGKGELLVKGKCFSNAPELIRDYVLRPQLEEDLLRLLLDDKHPIITLVGRGGIGKTSLVLKVIDRLSSKDRFPTVVWFSARDVDLQLSGPKPVRPLVVSPDHISKHFASLVLSPDRIKEKGFAAKPFFEQQMQKNDLGPCLFVFDNFETTQNPIEMFNWIDTFIRPPNKVAITTRLRDFKGDYPLEVAGMTEQEARLLVGQTATYLGISHLINSAYIDELISESEGHPYVIKILLGGVARACRAGNIPKMIAGSDEILTALFERTYASLSPCAQRAFLTLAAWNSSVPRVALEAVLLRSTSERLEIQKGVESILQFSMAESQTAEADQQEFISLPLVANVFGRKKLNVSPFKISIQGDVEILQMLGPTTRGAVHFGLAKRVENFIANISNRIERGESFDVYSPMLEMICRAYHPGWLLLARWHIETGKPESLEKAKDALRRFLEIDALSPKAAEAWLMLAHACNKTGDALGEVHALIERAQLDATSLSDVSNAANRLNQLLKEQYFRIDREDKRELAQRIAAVLEKRRSEADADDYSRMAWLAIHLDQEGVARDYVTAGLAIDQDNYHCLRLAQRLNMTA